MFKRYQLGMLVMVMVTVVTFIHITQAQQYKPCKNGNMPINDTFCDTTCRTLGPTEYHCDGGFNCCACSYVDVAFPTRKGVDAHNRAGCSNVLDPGVKVEAQQYTSLPLKRRKV